MKGMLGSILGLSLALVVSAQLGSHDGDGCPHYEFDCNQDGTQCIAIDQICDGEVHCVNGRDENNERCPRPMFGQHEGDGCPHYEFDCNQDGTQCIAIDQICDGTVHCDNGRDENNERCPRPILGDGDGVGCADYEFDCNSDGTQCITIDYLCDGRQHCDNGRDENNERCPAPPEVDEEDPWEEDWDDMDDDDDEEPELTRCNRELCDVVCQIGHVTDIEGCPTCECLQDPCMVEGVCGRRQECKVVHTCENPPCTNDHVEAECTVMPEPEIPCPMPMCATECPQGYQTNDYGCMTCDCRDACEGYECPANHMCLPVPENLPQHMVEEVMGRLDAICLHAAHMNPFLNRFGSEEIDDSDEDDDDDDDVMPGLCHQAMSEMHRVPMDRLMERAMEHNCHPDGSFKPTQCDFRTRQCWCVTDAGEMLENTRMNMQHDRHRPECQPHHTVKTEIVMVFNHNIQGSLDDHVEPLTQLIGQHLSVWTGLGEELIDIKTMRYCGENNEQLKVIVELTSDGQVSLPLLVVAMVRALTQDGLVIEYGEFTLIPMPEQFTTHHTSHPMEPIDDPLMMESHEGSSSSSSEEDEYTCSRIWREHRGLAVVAGVGGSLLMVVIIALLCSCCLRKRRAMAQFHHKRMDKYKENIAYNNDNMSTHPDVAITEKGGKADLYKVTVTDSKEKY